MSSPYRFGGGFGGYGGGFGGGFTVFGKRLAIALAVLFAVGLILRLWLGLGGLVEALRIHPFGTGFFRPWQLITYPLVQSPDPLRFLFDILALYFFGATLERHLGTIRFQSFLILVLLIGGVLGALLAPFVAGVPAAAAGTHLGYGGIEAAIVATVVAFGWLNPHARILLMFIIPVPAIAITWVTIAGVAVAFLMRDPWSVYSLVAIVATWAVVVRGIKIPDLTSPLLMLKVRIDAWRRRRRIERFEVVYGDKDRGPDKGNGPDHYVN